MSRARSPAVRVVGHAVSAAVDWLAGQHTLVVYGDSTADARLVADELRRRAGRSDFRIVVIEGGFQAWSRAGLACSSGPCAECGGGPTSRESRK